MFILPENNKYIVITKREDAAKEGFCIKYSEETPSSGKSLISTVNSRLADTPIILIAAKIY